MTYKICTKCKKRKIVEKSFYKIRKGLYYFSECKECHKKRAKEDHIKRGNEHNAKIHKKWCEKQGGKEYYKKVFKKYYLNNVESVKKRKIAYYHKTKKRCKICKKIKPKCFFKENPTICKICLYVPKELLVLL